ncbi:MAG: Smr/MutS family protein [Candidatus Adiutrix sp.]|jgi:DNA mismatch repair protein MutS2|nr:Smr/MutS family protein [Candidatus Adiutrix sp.]
MTIDDNTLYLLEYEAALAWLSEETHSEAGRLAALALTPDLAPEEILRSWSLIAEGREVLNLGDHLDLSEHIDLTEILEPLKVEGARLGVEELRAVGFEARTARAARSFFAGPEIGPGLADLAAGLTSRPELIEALERTIGPDGEILDTASPELARLRLEQAATRQGITSRLTSLIHDDSFRHLLQDDLITTRSERFVVPVRAGAAGGKRGLVHDWSKTGATAFLEPLEVVEDNNRLGLLKRKEKTEIERILRRLSEDCRAAAPDLALSGAILTRLDLILAQARLARVWAAQAPAYRPGRGFHLRQARHPLLMRRLKNEGGAMTALELRLEPEQPLLIISGLNTGGKTVAMKTLGLNLLLAKAGLHLPAGPDSVIDFPDQIMAVMGDEQDLSADLSTFSGHVRSLGQVLAAARPGVLVLLDEIGSGTDPAEGAALGLAVLEELRSSGALVMAATHYQLIKTWAALTGGVVSAAVNSSDSGQPLYGLSYGSPGFSGGLKMARRLGLPEELVSRAESFLDDGQRRAMELLARLDQERGRLALARAALEEETLSLARAEAELREQTRREAAEGDKKAQAQSRAISEALAETKREFEELKQAMRASLAQADGRKLMEFSEKKAGLDKRLRAARPSPAAPAGRPLQEVRPGDQVMVGKLGRLAVVRSVKPERGEVWVETGGLNVQVALADIFPPANPERPKQRPVVSVTVTPAQREAAGLELNLLGRTVEEALGEVARELDRAILDHRQKLYIVHGFGTGRLRQGIRHYLGRHPQVKHFERAAQQAGGDGVTVVTIES